MNKLKADFNSIDIVPLNRAKIFKAKEKSGMNYFKSPRDVLSA